MLHGLSLAAENAVKEKRISVSAARRLFQQITALRAVIDKNIETVDITDLCVGTLGILWACTNKPSKLIETLISLQLTHESMATLFAIDDDYETAFIVSVLSEAPALKDCPHPEPIINACAADIKTVMLHGVWANAVVIAARQFLITNNFNVDGILTASIDNRNAADPCLLQYVPQHMFMALGGSTAVVYPAIAALICLDSMGKDTVTAVAEGGRDTAIAVLCDVDRRLDIDVEIVANSIQQQAAAHWISHFKTAKKENRLWTNS